MGIEAIVVYMSTDRESGRATGVPAKLLPGQTFDLSEGQRLPSTPGKTNAPVNLLPELGFDLRPGESVPALQLSLSLRPGEVALDLLRLYVALNQLELGQHGAGLTPDEDLCQATSVAGEMCITLKATDPNGARDRLSRLAELINGVANIGPDALPRYASIERCQAQVLMDAA